MRTIRNVLGATVAAVAAVGWGFFLWVIAPFLFLVAVGFALMALGLL